MTKKSWKGKSRYNKRKVVHSNQSSEMAIQKPALVIQTSTKTIIPKTAATTKTMPDYSYIYTELKIAGTISGIILILIVILWLIIR